MLRLLHGLDSATEYTDLMPASSRCWIVELLDVLANLSREGHSQQPHYLCYWHAQVGEAALRMEKDKTSQEQLADVRMERFAEEERLRRLSVRSPVSPALSSVLLLRPVGL